jgi:tight adherence protein B
MRELWGSVILGTAAAVCLTRATRRTHVDRLLSAVRVGEAGVKNSTWARVGKLAVRLRSGWVAGLGLAAGAATCGWLFAGPIGGLVGVVLGIGGSRFRTRRGARADMERIEAQLADLAESASLGLRSGLSVTSALTAARAEAEPPLREHLDRLADEQSLGVPFDVALARLGDGVGTDDARLFVLVTSIHARSGGDLAGALDEVTQTIRHRIAVRRELRAASAQGRISGLIMGSLPIAFFLFLSVTSHERLAPVLRSGPGMAMVGAGLALEGLAYLWIRRLLRVEV